MGWRSLVFVVALVFSALILVTAMLRSKRDRKKRAALKAATCFFEHPEAAELQALVDPHLEAALIPEQE